MESIHPNEPLTEAQAETVIGGLQVRRESRRELIRNTVALGALGVLGATMFSKEAEAQSGGLDIAVLNFALNLEYLEAEYYLAAIGSSLTAAQSDGGASAPGVNVPGATVGGAAVPFVTPLIRQYALEIANDELNHVLFLRSVLGARRVAKPALNIDTPAGSGAFSVLAAAANTLPGGAALPVPFNPYSSETAFLLGAFIFEDVGVTAYAGGSTLLANRTVLQAAANILAVEAYHAAEIRTVLAARAVNNVEAIDANILDFVNRISDLRDVLDGPQNPVLPLQPANGDQDQGIGTAVPTLASPVGTINIVPTDANSLTFARTTRQVLNIVYGAVNTNSGLFFPNGLNGAIR